MRISIVGLPGSGKTYLAQAISRKLSIPHIQLDRFWFEAGGLHIYKGTSEEEKERVRAYVREKALAAIQADSWVSDGFYSRIQPEIASQADVVLFLNIPLWRRLLNHAKRIFQSDRHRELNIWHELTFFPEIVRRDVAHTPKLNAFLEEFKDKVQVLRSQKEMRLYLQGF